MPTQIESSRHFTEESSPRSILADFLRIHIAHDWISTRLLLMSTELLTLLEIDAQLYQRKCNYVSALFEN